MKVIQTYFSAVVRTLLLLVFTGISGLLTAQNTTLTGKVLTPKKETVVGANVFIKDTYDGATSDVNGKYSFSTDATGTVTVVCTMLGFVQQEKQIALTGGAMTLDFILQEKVSELDVVVISAGTIEASDEKRTTVLKPLDIVTTAGSAGDIYGALQTLPGTQRVGESEGLFVRGGAGTEAKTIIDGMPVNNPFFSSVPDVAARGRFSPFLFKGTVFSTGGYSAQYGEALSSVLVLETQDLPDRTSSSLAVSSVGVGAGHNHLFEKKGFSIGGDFNYTNLLPYFLLVPQRFDYDHAPEYFGASLNFRKKTSETGILKFYGYLNTGNLAMYFPDIDSTNGYKSRFDLRNENVYTNLSYREYFNNKWRLDLATSYSYNRDRLHPEPDTIVSTNALSQGRAMVTRNYAQRNQVRVGGEYQYAEDKSAFNIFSSHLIDNFVAGFAETDIFLGSKFVLRAGGRFENSSLLNKTNLAPRASLAFKTGKNSQASLAYGEFYQKPITEQLYVTQNIGYEKAQHYILNFQHVDDSTTFRVEVYLKNYDQLVLTQPAYTNGGDGYARGLDVFWRDKKTFRNVDYWISYTYLDTKRKYKNYPESVMPSFATTHNASVVIKKFFPQLMTSVGLSYFYASGRPYYNPNNPIFLGDKTYDYHSINANASYLTRIGGAFTVFVISVTNVPGFEQVYNYRYSYDGTRRESIGPTSKRSFFIGMFMSFGQDRSKEVINNNN